MVQQNPNDAEVLHRSGVSAYQNGDFQTALELILKAIKIKPDIAQYYNTFGVILAQTGSAQGAVKAYRKAVDLNNDYQQAYSNLGNILQQQNKHAESVECYAKAIRLNPDYPVAYNNLAAALYKLGKFGSAIENCRAAIKLKNNYAEAHNTLAAALQSEQRFDEAIESYDKTIEYAPDYAEAYYSRGMLYLSLGNFAKGWDDYQWRLKTEKIKATLRHDKPWWQGENFQGKTLLVHAEQGFGDSMQFIRYLPMVKERGGAVILAEKPELIGLFQNLEGIDDLVDIEELMDIGELIEANIKYDLYTTLMSLPATFGTNINTIPARIPYLFAEAPKIAHWRDKTKTDTFKIGIAWAGNPTYANNHNRSCTLNDFLQLAKIDNTTLFSLQKGSAAEQINNWPDDTGLIDLGSQFKDFTDTAAAIENMDLIISVDTCVAHLAGAMGKTTWLLLPHESDWRWLQNRPDCPWYPTMKLFRQKQYGNWQELFDRVAEEVKDSIVSASAT